MEGEPSSTAAPLPYQVGVSCVLSGVLSSVLTFNWYTLAIPGQCVHQKRQSDQVYDCLDRSDEEPFATRRALPRDPSKLEECIDERGNPGLECGLQTGIGCISLNYWCSYFSTPCPALGPGATIRDLIHIFHLIHSPNSPGSRCYHQRPRGVLQLHLLVQAALP